MRKAAIVLVTVAALTAFGALVAPARAATPATPGRIDTLRGATRAIVVFSWSWRTTRAVVRTYERARPGDRWRLVRPCLCMKELPTIQISTVFGI